MQRYCTLTKIPKKCHNHRTKWTDENMACLRVVKCRMTLICCSSNHEMIKPLKISILELGFSGRKGPKNKNVLF